MEHCFRYCTPHYKCLYTHTSLYKKCNVFKSLILVNYVHLTVNLATLEMGDKMIVTMVTYQRCNLSVVHLKQGLWTEPVLY